MKNDPRQSVEYIKMQLLTEVNTIQQRTEIMMNDLKQEWCGRKVKPLVGKYKGRIAYIDECGFFGKVGFLLRIPKIKNPEEFLDGYNDVDARRYYSAKELEFVHD